jgi:hypothetical protein
VADRKITDLTALTTPASADVLPIVDVSEAAAADKNKKITVGELFKGVPDGTAAAPAIAFESDDGNGIFLSTTDTVGIATNGSSRMTVSTTAVTSTLPVIVPDGTDAAPSVAFTGSGTDTGIYSPGVDQVAVATNGAGRLFVDASGNVGVGTAPNALFEVSGSEAVFGTNHHVTQYVTSTKAYNANPGGGIALRYKYNSANDYTYGAGISFEKDNTADGDFGSHITLQTRPNAGIATERLRITSAGLVGIGNGNPRGIIHVGADIGGGATDAAAINIKQTSTTKNTGIYLERSADRRGHYIYISSNNDALTFERNNVGTSAVTMVLDRDGKVGIGTTSPNTALHVIGAATSTQLLLTDATNATIRMGTPAAGIGILSVNTGQNLVFGHQSSAGSAYTERARIDSSGRLLVGTATSIAFAGIPAALQVQGDTDSTARISIRRIANDSAAGVFVFGKSRSSGHAVLQENDTIGQIEWYGADGADTNQRAALIKAEVDGTPGANDMPGRLSFATTADGASTPTERMRITQAGEIWINRTTRDAVVGSGCKFQLECTGAEWAAVIRNSNANPYGLRLVHDTDINNTSNAFLQCLGTVAQRAAIRTNGGLANYQSNNVNLSDINSKKDISPASDTWDCIKEWEIVNYRYKDQPDDADLNLGVIAQQVAESCPEVITVFEEAKDDQPEKLGVKEQQMYWMAIKALQEAQVRIEQLEAKVAALEAQ